MMFFLAGQVSPVIRLRGGLAYELPQVVPVEKIETLLSGNIELEYTGQH